MGQKLSNDDKLNVGADSISARNNTDFKKLMNAEHHKRADMESAPTIGTMI